MATTVNRNVNIYITSGEAEKAYDRLIKKEQQLKTELEKATDPKQIQRLKSEIDKLQEPITRAAKKMSGELQPTIRDLKATMAVLNKEFENVDRGTARFHQLAIQLQALNLQLNEAKNRAKAVDETNAKGFGSGIKSFLEGAGIGAGIGTVQALGSAVRNFFNGSIEEALQAENASARFRNTLDNLGRADAFDRLSNKAQKMADKFKFLDNDDVIEVFNKLITYGKLTERQIDELTPIIIDFAAKNRISLEEASSVIIKAMEGSGKALKEYGIKIKDSGDATERFNIIATTLKEKVDGAAESFGESLPGAIATSEQKLKDIEENIGTKLLPLKVKLLSFVDDVVTGFSKLGQTISLAFKLGINPLAAEELRTDIEAFTKFTTDQANKEFDNLKNLPAAELTTELIKLNAELEKTDKLLTGAKRQGEGDSDRAQRYRLRIEVIKNLIPQIKEQIDNADKLLGAGGAETTDRKTKIENLFAKFKEQLNDQARELDVINKAQIDKELIANQVKYDKQLFQLKEALKKKQLTDDQYGELVLQNEDNRGREQAQIFEKWVKEINQKRLEEEKKNQQKLKDLDEKRLQQLLHFQETLARNAAEVADKALNQRRFKLETDELIAIGRQKINIRIQQLKLERDAEIANAEKTGKDVADINRKYQKLIHEERIKGTQSLIQEIAGYVSQITSLVSSFFDLANERDQQQVEQERVNNDRKKNLYKSQLDSKTISQKEYDKKVQQLDKQQEEREKQARIREFNRNKIIKLLNATVNVAEQVASVIANPFLAAAVAILGAVQIGIIASSKPPKLGKGGRLKGPSHEENNGMPVINPRTGQVQAYVEGDEVILSKNTVRNNAALVDQLLHSSMYNNGARINPKWKTAPPVYMNLPVINDSINRVRMYAKGGVFTDNASSTNAAADNAIMNGLKDSLNVLNAQLAAGITAYTLITQNEKQQDRLNTIRADATMR